MGIEKRRTEKIKLWGIVQGVGFRPFVAKCADKYGMKGEVLNIGGLVDVVVTDTPERIDFFVERLMAEKPVPAEIVHVRRDVLPYREFDAFTILESDEGDDEAAMIPADLSLCPDCLRELYEEDNPRYRHPFISCMVCGPRYTVIDRFPYDRDNTAMIDWPMCDFCEGEYTTRTDRRYHAQTICCHDCGPVVIYKDREGKADADRKMGVVTAALRAAAKKNAAAAEKLGLADIERAAEALRSGGVIAMKGVGGYNLIADPLSPSAVRALREIKHREQKPFAVMFKDMETIKAFSAVNEVEEKLLESSAKPILLLEHRTPAEIRKRLGDLASGSGPAGGNLDRKLWLWSERLTDEAFAEIKKSRFVGSFLPSMGAQHLLLDRFGLLIVTSANLSDMPIIKDEDEMFALMDREPLIAGCLYNERDIRVRVDDSVARVIDGQPQMIRRSKGYAPVPLYITLDPGIEKKAPGKDDMLLACGGQLKNSFALSKGAFSYISQYFGDLDSLENQKIYAENVDRMATMFRTKPQLVVCDMHPLYATTAFAESYAKEHGDLPVIRVQHHHAHVASVMAEHSLKGAVIGVSMDGTGYGTDGAIWGGEFLLCEGAEMKRMAHLKYVDMIGGDSSMKDAAKTSLCFREAYEVCAEASDRAKAGDKWLAGCDAEDVRELAVDLTGILKYAEEHNLPEFKNPGEEELVKAAIRTKTNVIKSSSMGRLFDSVSALLGICPYNEYEGQCAILLEDAAARAMRAEPEEASEADRLALDFHMQVASLIYDECCKIREESGAKQVALTGGVFQNKILTEQCLKLLRGGGFDVYYNVSVSPNDGGIALGQNYVGMYHLMNRRL